MLAVAYFVAMGALPVITAVIAQQVNLGLALGFAGAGALVLHAWRHVRLQHALMAESEPDTPLLSWFDPDGSAAALREHWQARAADASFERVRGNLRLMGLVELWRTVSADNPDAMLFEAVLAFVRRETPLREVALLRLDPRAGELAGTWATLVGPRTRAHGVRWALGGIDGAVARAIRSLKPVVAWEPRGASLLTVGGERPRVVSKGVGFAVFPLLAPTSHDQCRPASMARSNHCTAFLARPQRVSNSASTRSDGGLDLGICAGCSRYPMHGVLVVTRADEAESPGPGSVGLLESLATTIASVLEHASLFRHVKNAERFREQVLDSLMNGLVSTDQSGHVVFVNQRARELFGDRDPIGQRLDTLLRLPGGSGALTHTLMEGKAYLKADAVISTESTGSTGGGIPVRVNLTPFRPEEGGMTGAVCVIEDRSSVRAMEEEIRHLDTLAAIGRFASGLAHEIRNPLGGIQAGIEFLARDLPRRDDTDENLEVIHGEIARLDGILKNLLSVARPRELVLADADPEEIVRRAVASFSAVGESVDVQIEWRLEGEILPIHADRDVLQQVLTNLIKNAIEASSRGGLVEAIVRAGASDHADAEPSICFEVLDRGPGIAESDLPRLFEPFFTNKPSGTGLGLYVCHGFIERHGGRLKAENRHGGGARFVVELPCVPALMGGNHESSHTRRR